jgi:hypothetical protein
MAKHSDTRGDKANMKGEEYLRGRRAGVEKTYGKEGAPYRGVGSKWGGNSAEATNLAKGEGNSGGNEELASAARSLYQDAVHNRGDKDGDKALTER